MTTTTHPVLADLTPDGDRVAVTFGYNPARVKKVKEVPSAKFVNAQKSTIKVDGKPTAYWRLALDLDTMRRLREVFGEELGLGDRLREWGVTEVSQEKKMTDLSQADDADLENEALAKLVKGTKLNGSKFQLRPYQKADIKFMASANSINANQPGAGKTIETIGAVMEADLAWGQHLIVAPVTSLQLVWEKELAQAYKLAGLDEPTILTGATPKERKAAVAEAKRMADEGLAFWLVLNPAMTRLKRQKVEGTTGDAIEYEEVLAHPELAEVTWDTITVDEFHLMGLSNPTTLGAQGINRIVELTDEGDQRRFALSGTPMGGKPVKLWGALRFLEPDKFTSRWNWARHWLVINHNGYGHSIEGIMPGREEAFYNHLKPYLVRRTKREALPGLPPKQTINVWCDMTAKQAEQYTVFEQDAEWRIDEQEAEGRLTATNILAEYTRLKQFAGAYCEVSKTGREVNGVPELKVEPTPDSGKIEQLIEKLKEENVITSGSDDEDEPKCALIFSQFKGMVANTADVLREAGVPVGEITGATSGKERKRLADAFQAQSPGAPRVMVMNTKAGGASITLTRADTVHILDEDWTPDNQEQAEDRAHRGDDLTMAKEEVRIYYYRTERTIEHYIQKLVAGKAMNNKTILDLRRRMQRELAEAEAAAGE